MKMIDMKLPKSKRHETAMPVSSGQDYPYGLTINLDNDSLKKLGMKELPEVGAECMVHGVGKIVRVSESAYEKEESRVVEIQITKLALSHDEEEEAVARGYKKVKRRY